ncbi:Uncharacterised protein [Shigella sonnei]|nr:Uncharacterised protein [Shigella sonnei]CSF05658.1 Uncharacterised protein [Shigella sonnei]CSF14099.1 Uncharacterised protein [Shigella sonnei]CSF68161.1 Uncharacterised protein [Shigella sonnei]CSF72607.1 Uncharacterised protein [Shigella sonnei]
MQDFIIKTVEFAVRPPDVDTGENKGDHNHSNTNWNTACDAGVRIQRRASQPGAKAISKIKPI